MIDITSLSSPVVPLTVPIQAVAPIPAKGNWWLVVLIVIVAAIIIWGCVSFYNEYKRAHPENHN